MRQIIIISAWLSELRLRLIFIWIRKDIGDEGMFIFYGELISGWKSWVIVYNNVNESAYYGMCNPSECIWLVPGTEID